MHRKEEFHLRKTTQINRIFCHQLLKKNQAKV